MTANTGSKILPSYAIFVDFLLEQIVPQKILAFQLPEAEQQRAIELLEKHSAGTLTPQEADELEQMRQIDSIVSLLKARAIATLSES